MQYPCIIYALDDMDIKRANNRAYLINDRYSVTVIDRDPDSILRMAVAELPTASFSRKFVTDNLNHFAFNLFF